MNSTEYNSTQLNKAFSNIYDNDLRSEVHQAQQLPITTNASQIEKLSLYLSSNNGL